MGRIVSAESAGCEIRFVSESDSIRVDVTAIPSGQNGALQVTVFKGGFLHSVHSLESGKINHLVLKGIASATDPVQEAQEAFDQILRELQTSFNHPPLHLIEGSDLLSHSIISASIISPLGRGTHGQHRS